jgi:hypothetical protein
MSCSARRPAAPPVVAEVAVERLALGRPQALAVTDHGPVHLLRVVLVAADGPRVHGHPDALDHSPSPAEEARLPRLEQRERLVVDRRPRGRLDPARVDVENHVYAHETNLDADVMIASDALAQGAGVDADLAGREAEALRRDQLDARLGEREDRARVGDLDAAFGFNVVI